MKVFITIDTEVWPKNWEFSSGAYNDAFRKYILGQTPTGDYGVPFQLSVFKDYGITADFFVESLFSYDMGKSYLEDIVGYIQGNQQHIQLHVHTEWLVQSPNSLLPGSSGLNLGDYTEEQQVFILDKALRALESAGANNINAFRAGNYGASNATLPALAEIGINFDTSYNATYLGNSCLFDFAEKVDGPKQINGVCEIPVTCFSDYTNHWRHAQLGAISANELETILKRASDQGWEYFVIVMHGHELLNADKSRLDKIVLKRFIRMCEYLSRNNSHFETVSFSKICCTDVLFDSKPGLSSNSFNTIFRLGEQLLRRVIYD